MSVRDHYPKPRLRDTHFTLSVGRGDNVRCLTLRPGTLYALLSLIPLLCTWYLGATLYFVFRDDMLASLMTRQAEMQYAYEDRLAAMRSQLDRVTSRQLIDQDSFEGRVTDLVSRQAQLESRAAIVASLADQAGLGADFTASIPRSVDMKMDTTKAKIAPNRSVNPLMTNSPLPSSSLPGNASSFAPVGNDAQKPFPTPAPRDNKPRPDGFELRTTRDPDGNLAAPTPTASFIVPQVESVDKDAPLSHKLVRIASGLEQIDRTQLKAIASLEKPAMAAATRYRSALIDAGLSPDRLSVPAKPKPAQANKAMGGPFVPLPMNPNGTPFEREVSRLQTTLQAVIKLRSLVKYVPLRRPLGAGAEITSGFGGRSDPFYGRAAMHSGIDFREDYGSPIRATAGGRVITAGSNGGYGNMVEIDHGNGLTTRYAHMSAINVEEDQWVEAGAVVGKLGSTGRSTGPHLHYEVRIDGEAVDPSRFLKAGKANLVQ